MKRYFSFITIGIVLGVLSTPFIVSSTIKNEYQHKIHLNIENDIIISDRLKTTLPPEIYNGEKIKVVIDNFFNRTISMIGYIDKATIDFPGNEEKINVFDWAEKMYRMTPRGANT